MTVKRVVSTTARPVKIWTDDVDDASIHQLSNIADMPFIHKWVAAMADVHLGKGATVGSVIATDKAIIPAAAGVDLGCGLNAVRLSLTASDLPDNLYSILSAIEAAVPVGAGGQHQDAQGLADNDNLWGRLWHIDTGRSRPDIQKKADRQLGTLGSGNHFIELCLDEEQRVWVMLHSGSRGVGNIIGSHFIDLAKRDMERYFINLPDTDLAYLPEGSEHFNSYLAAVDWAQDYALLNRKRMMQAVLGVLESYFMSVLVTDEAIECHHNYISRENHYGKNVWVTRKGAIRARKGDLGIIPGSMGAKSFIVRGKGNEESFNSCSHGAGRKMSRSAAKKTFSVDDLKAQTVGVTCRKQDSVIDEIPASYKSIDEVLANQTDLVEVVHTLKQVLCVKGS